jgi:hypothetical protein
VSPIFIFVLNACGTGRSSEVKQDTIVQNYRVTFSELENRIRADASFHYRSGFGTSLKLNEQSQVLFEGRSMDYTNSFDTASYTSDFEGNPSFDHDLTFDYRNNDGENFRIPVSIPPATGIRLPRGSSAGVPADRDLLLTLWGSALGKQETVRVCLRPENSAQEECVDGSSSSNRLTISSLQLARLPRDQELLLTLERTTTETRKKPSVTVSGTYVARPLAITLLGD